MSAKDAHRRRVAAAVEDVLRRRGRARRDGVFAPLERCSACGLPLVNGAAGFDRHPDGGSPPKHFCERCAHETDCKETEYE